MTGQRCPFDAQPCGLCLVGQCRLDAFKAAQERSLSPRLARLREERDLLTGRIDELEQERDELRERVSGLEALLAALGRPREASA